MLMLSPAQLLASLPETEREKRLAELSPETKARLRWHWPFWARPNQLPPPGEWSTWLALAGRGFGKTEAGAQWVRSRVEAGAKSIALVAETQKDLEEVMVARLLAIYPPEERPQVRYRPVRVTWPNGAQALGYNGNEPDQLRGPEFDTAWVDELAKYRYDQDTWDMLQFTMRAGDDPRVFVTTTPRPKALIKALLADPSTVVTRGSTFENAANLAPSFLDKIRARYEGTRLGRQELNAKILDDVPGALWTAAMFRQPDKHDMRFDRVVVGVDPSGASSESDEGADAIGICVAGVRGNRFTVIEDASCKLSPNGWARRVVERYNVHGADAIVAEKNFGGAMVEAVIRNVAPNVNIKMVTASRGKSVRAEPVAALYEQERVDHMPGLEELENQMMQMTHGGYVGEGSPDRLDACVWAITDLMGGPVPQIRSL